MQYLMSGAQPSYQSMPLASGRGGNIQTLQHMASFVIKDAASPFAHNLALCIVQNVAAHDELGEITALFNYTRDCIAYRMHPMTSQWVQDLQRTAQDYKSGDCTSKSVALATLLATLGYEADFRVCNYDPSSQEFSHVYVVVHCSDGNLLALDPSSPDATPGWQSQCMNAADYAFWPQYQSMMGQDGQEAVDTGGDSVDTSTTVDTSGGGLTLSDLFSSGDTSSQTTDTSLVDNSQGFFNVPGLVGDGSMYTNSDGTFSIEYPSTGQIDNYDQSGNYTGSFKDNGDGTTTFTDANGTQETVDANGNPIGGQTSNPGIVSNAKKAIQTALNTPGAGTSGGGIPGGGSSGGLKPLSSPTSSTGTDIASLVKSALAAFGIGTQASAYRTVTNPLTGQQVLINPATGLPVQTLVPSQGVNLTSQGLQIGGLGSISMTTLLLLAVFFFALRDK